MSAGDAGAPGAPVPPVPPAGPRREPARRRLPALRVLGALLVAGGAADRLYRPEAGSGGEVSSGMPVAAPARALTSTWYCAGASANPGGPADGAVIVANPGRRALTGSVTIVPSEGSLRTVPLTVPAASTAVVRHQDLVQSPFAAALVELDGGEVVVEHSVSGPLGASIAPCASRASDRWYFAGGSTAREDTMLLALFNPFPEDAIADLSFSTDQGPAAPADFKGIVVRGGSLSVVNVGEHVRRRDAVAATVAARRGRLVVDRIQLRNTGNRRGTTLALGAPSPGDTWYFPDGVVVDGFEERVLLYNPSDEEAEVDVEMLLDEGAAEPFEITVPPGEHVPLLVNDEDRIPKGVAHAIVVQSVNDVGVVAERSITAGPPVGRVGVADTLGAREGAERWVLAGGAATDTSDEWVIVQNLADADATVSFTALAGEPLAVDGLQRVLLPAGRRAMFRLRDHIRRDALGLLITASEAVVVERAINWSNGAGTSSSIGVPLR